MSNLAISFSILSYSAFLSRTRTKKIFPSTAWVISTVIYSRNEYFYHVEERLSAMSLNERDQTPSSFLRATASISSSCAMLAGMRFSFPITKIRAWPSSSNLRLKSCFDGVWTEPKNVPLLSALNNSIQHSLWNKFSFAKARASFAYSIRAGQFLSDFGVLTPSRLRAMQQFSLSRRTLKRIPLKQYSITPVNFLSVCFESIYS